MAPAKPEYVQEDVCNTHRSWLTKLVLGAATILLSLGALFFNDISDLNAGTTVNKLGIEHNEQAIRELKTDIKDIKHSQQTINQRTSEILGLLKRPRNITRGSGS